MGEEILRNGIYFSKRSENFGKPNKELSGLNLMEVGSEDIDLEELEIEDLDINVLEDLEDTECDEELLYEDKDDFLEKDCDDSLKLTEEERNEYTEKNLGLVNHVAKKFVNTGIDEEELVGIALEGYVKALNKYRKNKKTKFTTYAYRCMFNEILAYLRKEKKWTDNVTSLNAPIGVDKNGNVLDLEKVLKEDRVKELDEVVISKDIDALVIDSLIVLNDIEKYIIVHRFGISGKEEKTQKIIAEELNISQAYVSKLEKDCLQKIKKYIQQEDLKNGVLGRNQYFNY